MTQQNFMERQRQQWFDECRSRVRGKHAAIRLWTEVFDSHDRSELGNDFGDAYEEHKSSVGLWMAAKHVTNPSVAVVEVARELNLIIPNRAVSLLKALGAEDSLPNSERPQWNSQRGILTYQGETIRRVKIFRKPTNISRLLDQFEDERWKSEIEISDLFDTEQIRETLRSLKTNLKGLTFEQKAGGTKVLWRKLPNK